MPRRFGFLSLVVVLGVGSMALLMLALTAAAAPAAPSGLLMLEVNYAHDWAYVTTTPLASVSISVMRGGASLASVSGQADGGGNFRSNDHTWAPSQPDLQTGDTVLVTAPGSSTTVDPIGEIAGTLDVDADIVSGAIHAPDLAPANLLVRCELWVENSNVEPITLQDVPADGGEYSCDFGTVRGYDIVAGNDIAVRYFEPDGDQVINVFRAPAAEINVAIWPEGNPHTRAGGLALFHVRYQNSGTAPAENLVLTDTLPANTSLVTATLDAPMTTIAGGVKWELDTLAPGTEEHFFIVLSNSLNPGDTLHNELDISTSSLGDKPDDNHAQVEVPVIADLPDVNVGQNPHPWDPLAGDTYRIDVGYGNNGPVPAGPVTLHLQLPPDTTLDDWTSRGGFKEIWQLTSIAGGHLIFETEALPGSWGDELLVTVGVGQSVPNGTELESTVWIEEASDPNLENNGPNSKIVKATVQGRRDLRVEKGWDFGQLVPGGHGFYHLNYANDGNITQPSVRMTDTLPTGTTFVGSTVDFSWGMSMPVFPVYQDGDVVAWDLGELQPGLWSELRVELALDGVEAGDLITNTARIRGQDDRDRSRWNNVDTATEQINAPGPNLRVHKQAYWDWPGQIRYELQFENVGTTTVDNVRITDTLPAGVIFNNDWWSKWWGDLQMSYNPGTRQIVWTTNKLEPNWSGGMGYRVDLPAPLIGEQGHEFENSVEITLPQGDVTPADNGAETLAFTGPDVFVNNSLFRGALIPGRFVTFTVNFGNRNNGPWGTGDPPPDTPAIYITDTLPAGMSFVSANNPYDPPSPWQPSKQEGNTLTWATGGLCAGCQYQFQIVARISDTVASLTQLTNVVEIEDAVPGDVELYLDNNRSTWSGIVELYFDEHAFLPILRR